MNQQQAIQSLDQPIIDVVAPMRDAVNVPVVAGCCFPQGWGYADQPIAVQTPDGQLLEAGVRPLQTWPDGSLRWAEIRFETSCHGQHRVVQSHQASPQSSVSMALSSARPDTNSTGMFEIPAGAPQAAILDNGLVRIELKAGQDGPIEQLASMGRQWITQAKQCQFIIDQASSLHCDTGWIQVLCDTSMCKRVRVHGHHATVQGQHRLGYRLDVEMWANHPAVRLDYMFIHNDRGDEETAVEQIICQLDLNTGSDQAPTILEQLQHGIMATPKLVKTVEPVTIQANDMFSRPYVTDRKMLGDDQPLPRYLLQGSHFTQPWAGVSAADSAAYFQLHEMAMMHPKQMQIHDGKVDISLWPKEAQPLFLPQGRARRHTITLAFTPNPWQGDGSNIQSSAIQKQLDVLLHEGRAHVLPQWVRQCQECDIHRTLDLSTNRRVNRSLREFVSVNFARGMTDLGDGRDYNYERTYLEAGQRPRRRPSDMAPNPFNPLVSQDNALAGDSRYEPIWNNNEYDLIHALSQDLLRTGNRALWDKLRHAVRHNIEIDFVWQSSDPWQHHGMPAHSAYHNFASAYPSHLWTQGLLTYYRMTGDPDVLEVVMALAQTIIRNLDDEVRGPLLLGFNREIGWAALALVHVAAFTREPRGVDRLDRIMDYLLTYDRNAQTTDIKLSSALPGDNIHRQIVTGFFGYASMVEAVDTYAREFDRDDARQWIRKLMTDILPHIQDCLDEGYPLELAGMLTDALGIGYELTGDRHMLELGMMILEQWYDKPSLPMLLYTPGTPALEPYAMTPKFSAMSYRALSRFAHQAHQAGLLKAIDYQTHRHPD